LPPALEGGVYRLYFQMKTNVQMVKSTMIPLYGLTFTKFAEVCEQTADSDYLVGELVYSFHK
jgi:hypothetical protein